MAKILAIVVAYNPDIEQLNRNILSYISELDSLIVWDNSDISIKNSLIKDDKIIYMTQASNIGLAKPYRNALDYAYAKSYTHLLTMDQDSYWEDFALYKDYVLSQEPQAIYGPYRPLQSKRAVQIESDATLILSYNLINSGMLASVRVLKDLDAYWDKLFIDGIDEDLMCKAIIKTVPSYFVKKGTFFHSLGYPVQKKFMGKTYSFSDYSAMRLRDRYRSLFLLRRKYPQIKQIHKRLAYDWLRVYPIRIILGSEHMFSKLWAMLYGSIQGIFSKID